MHAIRLSVVICIISADFECSDFAVLWVQGRDLLVELSESSYLAQRREINSLLRLWGAAHWGTPTSTCAKAVPCL